MIDFSRRLIELRLRKNITQEELANKVGISRSAIANYEQGKREPSFDVLDAFADFFNVDINYLLGGDATKILNSYQEKIISLCFKAHYSMYWCPDTESNCGHRDFQKMPIF